MAYQVIARKYRPQKFSDVVGQEHVSRTLGNAIVSGRIAHAYLFVGPRGTGKTTTARIFAKCLNCTDGPAVEFPDDDPRAQEIADGRSLDVYEIDGASNRGIEEIRELRETVKYAPANSKYKIYIIDEVHMLTKEAFNALLKTLEEPPEHVIFLFATTEPEKVLPTILSRCQRFDLRRIPTPLIVTHLASISEKEGIKIDDAALHAIARGADGGMRDAESTLDQLISFCGEEIHESDVLSMFGLTSRKEVVALAQSILDGDVAGALQHLNFLADNGKDLGRLITDLLAHFRNLMVFGLSKGNMDLVHATEAESEAIRTQVKMTNSESLTRIMEIFSDGEGRMRDVASKKILLEIAVVRAVESRHALNLDSVLTRIQDLRKEAAGFTAAPALSPISTPPAVKAHQEEEAAVAKAEAENAQSSDEESMTPESSAPEPVAEAQPEPPVEPETAGVHEDLAGAWPALLKRVCENRVALNAFCRAYPLEVKGVSLVIGASASDFGTLSILEGNAEVDAMIVESMNTSGVAIKKVVYTEAEVPSGWSFASVMDYAPSRPAPTEANGDPIQEKPPGPAKPMDMEAFKNDPQIKKALEIFRGEVVEVRPDGEQN